MATLFSSVLCILILFQLTAADNCQTTNSPCKAKCGEENVDLSHMLKYPYSLSGDGASFSISPCEAVDCDSIENVAVCQDSNNKKFSCGLINDTTWSLVSTSSPFTVTVSFNGGRTPSDGYTRNSQITIIKVNNVSSSQLIYVNEDTNTNTFHFTIYTNNLAPSSSGVGNIIGPIGLTLILLAIVGLVTYFIVGSLIMYFVKGARGMEIIPNLGFWKSLPFLVKDGCLFVISPCYKRGSYEKI